MARAESVPRQTETGLAEHWATPVITVVLDPSLDDLGPGARDAVRAAMTTWAADVGGLPSIAFEDGESRVGAARDGVSVISAGPITLAGHQKDLALTTTYAEDSTGGILEADVVFNTKYAFASMPTVAAGCDHVFDVGAVATHESGHFFGLGEDWDDQAATMYIITEPCDAHKRALTPDDTEALGALYATPATMTAITSCTGSPARPAKGATVWVALGFALALGARRMRRA
ncbi:MAG TPA: matrixin family metalloprotease [Polyangiaceae bacterium]